MNELILIRLRATRRQAHDRTKGSKMNHQGLLGFIAILLHTWLAGAAAATTFPLPSDDIVVVGELDYVEVKAHETLLDIARAHGLGLNELAAANPRVDPWLPKEGQRIVVPKQFILPEGPREGIVINLPEMRLYYYPPARPGAPREVMTFPLGIGAEERSLPLMNTTVSEKKERPAWVVPESIRAEHAARGEPLPKVVPPGPDNPLGEYSMRLGGTSYLIHGTNKPFSVGMRVSHGCLRMYPEDIARLYPLVPVGTPVRVVDQPFKVGWADDGLYIEAHPPMVESHATGARNRLTPLITAMIGSATSSLSESVWSLATSIAEVRSGVPTRAMAGGRIVSQGSMQPIIKPKGTEWMVQVGAFTQTQAVNNVKAKLMELNLPVVLESVRPRGPCRILVGPYQNRRQAEEISARIKSTFDLSSFLRTTESDRNPPSCVGASA
ncbi:MAG: L,D-transpeptidase family protein [Pseudomonadota bacterium]